MGRFCWHTTLSLFMHPFFVVVVVVSFLFVCFVLVVVVFSVSVWFSPFSVFSLGWGKGRQGEMNCLRFILAHTRKMCFCLFIVCFE